MVRGLFEVRSKNQVTLPKALAAALHIQEGDLLEYSVEDGKIIITPKMLIPKEQTIFSRRRSICRSGSPSNTLNRMPFIFAQPVKPHPLESVINRL